jgi:O-glycosyl hydrolase
MKKLKMQNITIFILSFIFLHGSCTSEGKDNPSSHSENQDQYLEITLKPDKVHQTIKGFGASDAWSTQFVGKNWPLIKRNKIADLLFSDAFDTENNPVGIGLGQWRFNVGAGSSAQGNSSGIEDAWRRTESFMSKSGYNWNAQEGQRWFMQAAKERGVNQFTAFSNSPPITMTKNGKAHSSGGSSANIEESKYAEYIDFLVAVLENHKNLYGVEFNYVSPFNEPQWDWTGGQEGTPWQNSEIASITRLLDTRLKEKNLNTKIEIAEAGQLNYLYETGNREGRANQLQDFFSPSSQNYIGDLSKLAQKVAGHSYYTTFDTARLIDVRSKLVDEINNINPSLEFWMTEYTLLENNTEIVGSERDLGINPALYMARVIHADLTVANASSWQWWLAVSPYEYKDGLVYIDYDKNDGGVYDSKLLWTLGNYSKFIKAGDQRIGVSRSDNKSIEQSINGVLVSAYRSNTDSKYVAVVVNQRNIEIPIKLRVNGQESFAVKSYQTSSLSGDNLRYKGITNQNDIVNIPARSIVTLVLEY